MPGITFNAGEGGQPAGDNLKIRGFDAGSDVFIDGVRDAGSQTRDVFALEQIEVIKGPGSAYSGRGSSGGSVNLVTKKPRDEEFVNANIGAGTDSYGRAAFDANYRFGDSGAFRLNCSAQDDDVPGRNGVSSSHWGMAPSLAFGIGEDTRFNLDFYRYETDDIPDYSIPYARNAANNGARGRAGRRGPRQLLRVARIATSSETGADVRTFQFAHDFGDSLTLTNITRYGRTTNDYIVTNPDDGRGNIVNGFLLRNAKSRNSQHDDGSESHERERRSAARAGPRAQLRVRLRSEPGRDAEPPVRRLGDVRGQRRDRVRHVVQRPRRGRRGCRSTTARRSTIRIRTIRGPARSRSRRRRPPWTTDTRSVYAFDTLGFDDNGP